MKKKILGAIILALIIFEIFMVGSLAYKNSQGTNMCVVGENCNDVQNSVYGQLFGIKLPYYAIGAFVLLFIVYFIDERLFFSATIVGAVVSIYLISVQTFILKQFCSSCMIVDSVMILIFIFALINLILRRK